jgi:hypothetical protein
MLRRIQEKPHISCPIPVPGPLENQANEVQVRAILGLFNAFALMLYAHGVRRAFGRTTAVWYVLLQACQFHVIYYASRTLPNMFAFGISTLRIFFPLINILFLLKLRNFRHHSVAMHASGSYSQSSFPK